MKVSIITVTFNSASTIKDTLLSVIKQNYGNIEHIIVDGNSTDNTLAIIAELGHKGPILCENDKGIYDAMNKGISLATGDIVGILNSDDYLADESAIARIVDKFNATNCDAVYGDLVFVHPYYTHKVQRKWVAGEFNRKAFLKGWMPPHPTFYVKRICYQQHGQFNIQLKSSADYDLLLRFLFVKQLNVQYLPSVLIHMRMGGKSTRSITNRLKAHREDYIAWRINQQHPHWYTLILKPLRKLSQYLLTPK